MRGIRQNKYLVFASQFLAHSSQNPWNLRSDNVTFVGNEMTRGWGPIASDEG